MTIEGMMDFFILSNKFNKNLYVVFLKCHLYYSNAENFQLFVNSIL